MNDKDIFWNPSDESAHHVLDLVQTKPSEFWETEGHRRTLAIFHEMAERVPAYKAFLNSQNIAHTDIKSWEDFQSVPSVSKENYLRRYPLEQLCWDGTLEKPLVFTATSGSTGEPCYFPRGETLDWQYSVLIESFLKSTSPADQPTLVIICFGMGVWIGGLITYKAFELAGQRMGAPLSIITPGLNKKEIFSALSTLALQYKQVVIVGYPPFLKDIVDECPIQGIDLKRIPVRFICAAEGFPEDFRTYLSTRAAVQNPVADTLNIYGSADMGAMAQETGACILIKKLFLGLNIPWDSFIFSKGKTPTIAQYNPLFIQFEHPEDEILLSANNELPLMRYAIGDRGGVFTYKEMESFFETHKIDFQEEERKHQIRHCELPFVFVYERTDFSTKLYGALVYPEHVREVLYQEQFQNHLTGKFTMLTRHEDHEQILEIHVELKPGVDDAQISTEVLAEIILRNFLEKNSEYHNNYQVFPHKVVPTIVCWEYNHPTYFQTGIKQKWVQK